MHHIDCCRILELETKARINACRNLHRTREQAFLKMCKMLLVGFLTSMTIINQSDDEKVNDKG